jgi:hypothetical protein
MENRRKWKPGILDSVLRERMGDSLGCGDASPLSIPSIFLAG